MEYFPNSKKQNRSLVNGHRNLAMLDLCKDCANMVKPCGQLTDASRFATPKQATNAPFCQQSDGWHRLWKGALE